MPTVNGLKIEVLTAKRALNLGYLTYGEYISHVTWVKAKIEEREYKRFVYINGEYVGMCSKYNKLHEIIDKFVKNQ